MIFVDVPFPDCIAFGSQFEPEWKTTVIENEGGYESSVQKWSQNRLTADVSFAVRTKTDYLLILDHFNMVRARARSFPFKNHLDFETTQLTGTVLSLAFAEIAANGTYYLHRKYGTGSNAFNKRITRPDSPVAVYRTRSAVTTNITGAGASITYTTGAVAITGHAGGDTYSWAGTFMIPCRYGVDRLPAAVVNKSGEELIVSCDSIPVREVRE